MTDLPDKLPTFRKATKRTIAAREKRAARARERIEADRLMLKQATLVFEHAVRREPRRWPEGMPPTAVFAGVTVRRAEIRATIALLSYLRGFLASDCDQCWNLEDEFHALMSRPEARRRLAFLVNVAINRKAGIPDRVGRKQEPEYQTALMRDCRRVRDRVNRRISVRQFETPEIRSRFAHLLTTED